MELLYWFEGIRIPVLNEFMLLITRFGEETALLVAALIVFWCVDKRHGYYILGVGLVGTMCNQIMKLACRIPRPWVRDPNFTILEQAREAASGYSFPSGHSQTAVGTFGALARLTKNRGLKAVWLAIAVLVPVSRMYVGVHTPQDVLVGSLMALVLVFLVHPLVYRFDGKYIPHLMTGMAMLSVAFLVYVELWPWPADMDADNLQSGVKNAYTMLGCTTGLLLAWWVDAKKLHFHTEACWWVQIIKVVLGLAVVLAVKEGLRAPLEAIFAGHMLARAARYFLIVIVAGVLYPMFFRFFSRMGRK